MSTRNHCPHCYSEETQAARMVIASGTQDWHGAALSQQLGTEGGFEYTAMGGTSQSRLAAALDPGAAPSYLYPFLGTVLCVPFFSFVLYLVFVNHTFEGQWLGEWFEYWSTHYASLIIPSILAGLLGAVFFLRTRLGRVNWRERLARLDYTWLCKKCGCVFEAGRG